MTPQELREIASQSTENEYNNIINELTKAAREGSYSTSVGIVSDAVLEKLRNDGYRVETNNQLNSTSIFW